MPRRQFCYDYPRPMVTADCAVFRVNDGCLELLLVQRRSAPEKGHWALPGGFVQMSESLEAAARRELKEETGIDKVSCLLQVGAYGAPKRDPRGRVISIGYLATIAGRGREPAAASDAEAARWHPVEQLPESLAFDHPTIIGDALRRLTSSGRSGGILFSFLRLNFTVEEMADVLLAVYGTKMAPMTYLKPFIDGQVVKRSSSGGKFRFVGWHSGMCR